MLIESAETWIVRLLQFLHLADHLIAITKLSRWLLTVVNRAPPSREVWVPPRHLSMTDGKYAELRYCSAHGTDKQFRDHSRK